MISQAYTISMMIKVIFVFCLFYIVIPSRITRFDEESDKFLDKVFISLTHSTFVTIIIVHVLVFLKLYDYISLLLSFVLFYMILAKNRGGSWFSILEAIGLDFVVKVLDYCEKYKCSKDVLKAFYIGFKNWLSKIKKQLIFGFCSLFLKPFSGVFPLLVLAGAAYIRFNHSIKHAAYSHIDVYLHAIWVKYLGTNQIYHDGVYPHGLHAVVSALEKITFIDPYWVLRFFGAIAGILMVLGVYYLALRITQSYFASLVSVVIYGTINTSFPNLIYRQTAALSQEFGAVFILPGLYFLFLYLKTDKRRFLFLYLEALACSLLVHSFAALYCMIWSGIMFIGYNIFFGMDLKKTASLIQYGFLTGIISMLPLGLGYIQKREFHQSSIGFIKENINIGQLPESIGDQVSKLLFTNNMFQDIIVPLFLILFIYLFLEKNKYWSLAAFAIGLSTVISYILYRATDLHLPMISRVDRATVFLALILAVLYAVGFSLIEKMLSRLVKGNGNKHGLFARVLSFCLCLFFIISYPTEKLYAGIEEYDVAAENYLRIKNEYPASNWTIVGPQEQLSQALGKGWHYDIIRFVQNFTFEEVASKKFDFPIPTNHIFIFTEKRPLRYGKEITSDDALKDLEPEGDDPFIQYYKNGTQRAILEAKAIRLAEAYLGSHKGASIFYEDENMKIYYIYHEIKNEENLK